MKFRYLIPIFVLCAAGWAQPNIGAMQNLPNVFTSTNTFQGQVFLSTLPNGCLALTAGLVVSQPCGQTSFALISSGVNTFATMNCGSGCSLLASGSGTIAGTGLANNGNTVVLNGTGITWTDLNHNFISSSSSAVILSFGGAVPAVGFGSLVLSQSSSGAGGAASLADGNGDALILAATGSRAWNINLSNTNITSAFINTTGSNTYVFGSPLILGVNPTPGTTSPSISNGFTIASTGTSAVGPQTLFERRLLPDRRGAVWIRFDEWSRGLRYGDANWSAALADDGSDERILSPVHGNPRADGGYELRGRSPVR